MKVVSVHRQKVDDVGSALPVLVAVAHQAGGDRIAVGLITDQDAAEIVAGLRVERFQQR